MKQFEVSTQMAKAIQDSAATIQSAQLELQHAERRLATARLGQQFIEALVVGAGYKPEDFARFEIVSDDGKLYVRAA